MASAEQIRHLKLVINAMDVTQPRESWQAPGLQDGVPKGAIIELQGPSRFEWFITFLKENPSLNCFWAEKSQSVLPTALHQRGIDLNRITFAVFKEKEFPSLRKVIQSQIFPVVISTHHFNEIKMLQSFQLLTEKSNSSFFMAAEKPVTQNWPVALQLDISGKLNHFNIEILKQRYRKTNE
ncbi:MAG: hypothetical protein K0R29_384 [Pseudobdellovibrio sp.]|nr:hypothetical protein [Pseudobdellovibrio sp.]